MNKNNVQIVVDNVCAAFSQMKLPTLMGVDVLSLAMDSEFVLPEEATGRMRQDFTEIGDQMEVMFLEGGDEITVEEIHEGYRQIIADAKDFAENGPTDEQKQLLEMHRMLEEMGGSDEQSNNKLH